MVQSWGLARDASSCRKATLPILVNILEITLAGRQIAIGKIVLQIAKMINRWSVACSRRGLLPASRGWRPEKVEHHLHNDGDV